jgi:hypothetical protein
MSTFNLPVEMHLPGYNFCGPGTKLKKRLARGDKAVNRIDEVCKRHDINYSSAKSREDIKAADSQMLKELYEIPNPSFKEKVGRFIAYNGIKAKQFFGGSLLYCLKCKKRTETGDASEKTLRNGKKVLQGLCVICGSKKSRFLKKQAQTRS